ncbi:MAG: cyclic nucleotide-binding domain-containing protein [Leptospiraceae bacterium]|nr:cyclic nucleotide-binding domain-containing protein [Leptospiraceae bacterium]
MGKQTDWSKLQTLYKGFREGVEIIREGQNSAALYILVSGRLNVFKKGVKVLQIQKRGDYIGEISILLNIPSSASVKAETATTLIEIESSKVLTFLRHSPDIAISLANKMAERLAQLNSNFAELIDRSYRPDLIQSLKNKYDKQPPAPISDDPLDLGKLKSLYVEVPENTEIIEQGKYPNNLYILVKGTVEILKNQKMIAVENKSGYYIGDVSILRNTSANASVKTRTKCTFIRIPITKVDYFLNHSPDIAISISKKLAERIITLNDLFLDIQSFEVEELQKAKKGNSGIDFDGVLNLDKEIYDLLGIDPNNL